MITLNPLDKTEIERLAADYRAKTGEPIYVPPSLFRECQRQGLDMGNIVKTKPLPVCE